MFARLALASALLALLTACSSMSEVTPTGKNSYSVTYRGTTLLLRAETVGEGTRVVALGADGRPLTSGPATALLALLKARLG